MTVSKLIRNIKAADKLILTPRLDDWLMKHPEGIIMQPEQTEMMMKLLSDDSNSQRSARFGASSRGTCERAQVFSFIGMPQRRRVDPQLQNIFNDGTWRHLRWQTMLMVAGLATDVEVVYKKPQWNLKVSVDAENKDEEWFLELKGHGNIGKVIHEGIPERHLLQMHTCFIASDYEKAIYIAEDKRSQDWKEVVVHRDPVWERRAKKELNRLNDALDDERLPRVLTECLRGTGPTFHGCPYSQGCLSQDYWPKDQQWDD
jgi:hypothetical protein